MSQDSPAAVGWFAALMCFILRLRYRLRIVWVKPPPPARGVLLLPNHPAEIDPVILTGFLWPSYRPRPVIIEDFYHMPGINILFRGMGAIPMPNPDGGIGAYKRRRISQALDAVVAALDRGDNVVLYPAGRLMRGVREELRGTSATHELLRRRPGTQVVLVRTRGLLGSDFSWITHRRTPDLAPYLLRGLVTLLGNLLFFTPRRPVTMTCEADPASLPRLGERLELNRWLEAWFNAEGDETPLVYPRFRWTGGGPQPLPDLPAAAPSVAEVAPAAGPDLPPEKRAKLLEAIARLANRSVAELNPSQDLARQLGLDSLAVAEITALMQDQFDAGDLQPEDLKTVGDCLRLAAGHTQAAGTHEAPHAPPGWDEALPRPALRVPAAETPLHLAFLETCAAMPERVAMGDEVSGVLPYARVRLGVILLATAMRRWPEERVGILLPAGAGAGLCVMATLLAGKTPVMLNWTLGDANLKHVLAVAGLRKVLSAGRFLDRLANLNLDLIGDSLVTLEDLRREFTLSAKLRALLLARRSPAAIAAHFGSHQIPVSAPAVLLFTSGSEAAPKGVPLTHANILANLRGALAVPDLLRPTDILLGFLPPFHSFGFTVATILPMVSGLKVVYYPNPTDSRRLVRLIAGWRPTLVAGTPTFVAGILKAAVPGQLRSLRLVICGAEKMPDELPAQAKPHGDMEFLEGYGITETAPVLTLTPPHQPRVGVGQPLGDARLLIVHPETRAPLAQGERGLVLASGSNVFGGYLGRESDSVFHQHEGRRWYITGDLGFLDAAGNLTLAGRLKRFVKIGGEMISLPAMEEAILKALPEHPEGKARGAMSAYERDGQRPVLAWFTVQPLTVSEVNALLQTAGFSGLSRVQEVLQVPEIPLLGTGKTDYRGLTALLTAKLTRTTKQP